MANKPLMYYHNTLNEADTSELKRRMEQAESETLQIYELAKIFKRLSRRQAYFLYQEIFKREIQVEEVGRALSDLRAMGYLLETDERIKADKGAYNMIYELNPNPPKDPIKIPKKICVPLKFKENENGDMELDLEGMSDEFISKLNHWDNIFSPQTTK